MKTLKKSLVVEAALAGLFAVAMPVLAADAPKAEAPKDDAPKAEKKAAGKHAKADKSVHCLGVNACKGTSECGVDGAHGCKGQNACKGKGWTSLTKKDCKKQGGKVQGMKAEAKAHKAGMKTETAPVPAAK